MPSVIEEIKTTLPATIRLNGQFTGTICIPIQLFKIRSECFRLQNRWNKVHQMNVILIFFPKESTFLIHRYGLRIACPSKQIKTWPARFNCCANSVQNQITTYLVSVIIRSYIQQRNIQSSFVLTVMGKTAEAYHFLTINGEKHIQIGRDLHLAANCILCSLIGASTPAFVATVPHFCDRLGVRGIIFYNTDLFRCSL
ncbi:hypothetical protein D3C78_1297090 [compost metagenome]